MTSPASTMMTTNGVVFHTSATSSDEDGEGRGAEELRVAQPEVGRSTVRTP